MIDILFIIPDSSKEVYQGLADKYSAIEPAPWALLLAGGLRKDGYSVGILDPLAEGLTDEQAYQRIVSLAPRYLCFVIYGQNPNSGTTSMTGAVRLSDYIKQQDQHRPIIYVGSHPSALPDETIKIQTAPHRFVCDFVCPGDGLNALRKILDGEVNYRYVVYGKPCETSELDYAWDLVDLSKYRCHTWHNNFGPDRSPFASIYTSLGCVFKCDFCMINMVNKSSDDQLDASQATGIRYFDPEYILDQLQKLQDLGVKNVRIADEMFFLNKQHYLPLLRGIIDRNIGLNLWAYARVDTVRPEYLAMFKQAGINWLCLGIEAANETVRREITKGSYETVDVRQVAKEIKEAGINLLANFIFGLPDEDEQAMQDTLSLAIDLQAEHTNVYPCMALPGSPLYRVAVEQQARLPDSYSGYSFHSYDCLPLPTKHCTAAEVLAFRDRAWLAVSTNAEYLAQVERKFGIDAANRIREQSKIQLRRKILES